MSKKLYRDPAAGSLSGVCAGLGDYFDIDKIWFRVIFILSVLTTFMGVGLIGPIVYVVLWIALPVKSVGVSNTTGPWKSDDLDWTARSSNPQRGPSPQSFYDVDYRVTEAGNSQNTAAETSEETTRQTESTDQYPGEVPNPGRFQAQEQGRSKSNSDRKVAGIILIVLGLVLLAKQMNWIIWVDVTRFWPLGLIVVGVFILVKGLKPKLGTSSEEAGSSTDSRQSQRN